jgi:hypothetical protein
METCCLTEHATSEQLPNHGTQRRWDDGLGCARGCLAAAILEAICAGMIYWGFTLVR